MIAVIFDVEPVGDHQQGYLDIAADIRPLLDEIVAHVLRDYGLFDRNQAPVDSRATHSE